MGLLGLVEEIRSVSGGSLVAAWIWRNTDWMLSAALDMHRFEAEFAGPLRKFLTEDIRSKAFLATLGLNVANKEPRVARLAGRVEAFLFSASCDRPSNEQSARFRLVAFDVDREAPYGLRPDATCIGRQVIASAAFPPLIGPVTIGERRYLDGGLASNIGVDGATLHEWNCLLVSDASRGLPAWLRRRHIPASVRAISLVKSGSDRTVRRHLAAANSDSIVVAVAPLPFEEWFGNDFRARTDLLLGRLARLRTDLAGFSPRMVAQLEAAGEALARDVFGQAIASWAVRVVSGEAALLPRSENMRRWLAAFVGEPSKH